MAVAAGVSAHAEHKRQQAIANITRLLEKLHDAASAREHAELNACRSAVDKATAILLDEGEIGVTLGLGPAVQTIRVAMELARDRLEKWQHVLSDFGDRPVEIATLRKTFGGIDEEGGEFRAHLELAEHIHHATRAASASCRRSYARRHDSATRSTGCASSPTDRSG
jgi:hypothetical protein